MREILTAMASDDDGKYRGFPLGRPRTSGELRDALQSSNPIVRAVGEGHIALLVVAFTLMAAAAGIALKT